MRTQHRRPLVIAATLATALLGGGMLTAQPAAAATDTSASVTDCAAASIRADGMLDVGLLQDCLGQVQSYLASVPDDVAAEVAESAPDAFDAVVPVEFVAFEEEAPAYEGSGGSWADLRDCESGGDYGINTGNGYYGAYQFSLSTWEGLGYEGYPHDASPAVQDQAARELQGLYGWGQWPACSSYLGLG